jgi:hypothetical protein
LQSIDTQLIFVSFPFEFSFNTANQLVSSITNQDTLVLLAREFKVESFASSVAASFVAQLAEHRSNVATFDNEGAIVVPTGVQSPVKRVIYVPIGPLNRDFDDVRRFQDAAESGIARAIKAGGKKLLLVLANEQYQFETADYSLATLVTVLGAFHAVYVVSELN